MELDKELRRDMLLHQSLAMERSERRGKVGTRGLELLGVREGVTGASER